MATDKKEIKLNAKHYDILLRPVITEKTSLVSEQGKIVFEVPVKATKREVAAAVAAIYKVGVKKVNTSIRAGQARAFKGIKGRTGDRKHAFITLADGAKIDLSSEAK